MNKMLKQSTKIIVIIMIALVLIASICFTTTLAYAEQIYTKDNNIDLNELCNKYTDSLELYDPITGNNITNILIGNYAQYLEDRFHPGDEGPSGIVDEQILKIIPEELFKMKIEYLHIGKTYGFYIRYNTVDNTYLVYLLKTKVSFNEEGDNHPFTKIEPLYYEKYTYNEASRTASLEYVRHEIYIGTQPYYYSGYRKYSDVEKLFLKDVSFSGRLFNMRELNQGQEGYLPKDDNGAFFLGSKYKYKGQTKQGGQGDIGIDTALMALGYVPMIGTAAGAVMDAVEFINNALNFSQDLKKDFRNDVTNETTLDFTMSDYTSKETQILKFGFLAKEYGMVMNTDINKPILFGINRGDYIENTFYTSTSSILDTRLSGRVTLDIVSEFDGVVSIVADNITSEIYNNDIRDGVQTKKDIPEGQDMVVNALGGIDTVTKFTAPQDGNYTISFSNNNNTTMRVKGRDGALSGDKNEIKDIWLDRNEQVDIVTRLVGQVMGKSTLRVDFTPQEIEINATQRITIPAHKDYYFKVNISTVGLYNYNAIGDNSLKVNISKHIIQDIISHSALNTRVDGTFIANEVGKYYINLYNNSNIDQEVVFAVEEPEALTLNHDYANDFTYDKAYMINLPFETLLNLTSQSSSNVSITLYDGIIPKEDRLGTNINLLLNALGSKSYCVRINKYDDANLHSFRLQLSPDILEVGLNEYNSQTSSNKLYQLKVAGVESMLRFTTTSGSIQVYDATGVNIGGENESIHIVVGATYYVMVNGNGNYDINVSIISTQSQNSIVNVVNGQYNQYGFDYIRFTPSVEGNYMVNDTVGTWFDSRLNVAQYMNVNETYYYKVNGTPSASYRATIALDCEEIIVGSIMNVTSGYYQFTAESSEDYIFKFYSNEIGGIKYNIIDSSGQIIYANIASNNDSKVYALAAGKYYINVVNATMTVEMTIIDTNELESDSVVLNESSTYITGTINANSNITLRHAATKTDKYYFKTDNGEVPKYNISFYYILNGKIIELKYDYVDDNNLFDSDSDRVYAIGLNAGVNYYITISNTKGTSLTLGYKLSVPTEVMSVFINNLDCFNQDTSLVMGLNYEVIINVNNNATIKNVTWEISNDSNSVGIKDGNTLKLKIIVESDKGNIVLKISDEFGDKTISLKLLLPQYATGIIEKHELNIKAYEYSVTEEAFIEISTESDDAKNITGTINIGGNEIKYSGLRTIDLSRTEVFSSTIFKVMIDFEYKANKYTSIVQAAFGDLFEYIYESVSISECTVSYMADKRRLVIDASNYSSTEVKNIVIPSNIVTLFIISKGSVPISNINISISSGDNIYICLINLNIASNDINPNLLKSDRIDTTIKLNGNNKLRSYSTDSVVKTKKLTIIGDGNLSIIGNDGTNVNKDGTNALISTELIVNIVFQESNSAQVNIVGGIGYNGANGSNYLDDGTGNSGSEGGRGGNGIICSRITINNISENTKRNINISGGNGGNGGHGVSGKAGVAGHVNDSMRPPAGGNGANGGNGGNGGIGGIALNINCDNIILTNGYDGWGGNGGRGGDGYQGVNSKVLYPSATQMSGTFSSNGGNGAHGGNAGENGGGNLNFNVKNYGRGGDAGDGKVGGNGLGVQYKNIYTSFDPGVGGKGGVGGNGYYGGDGGDGGNGGAGGAGRNAVFLQITGSDGRAGGNGGDAGHGGHSISGGKGTVGYRGEAGVGGAGGAKGSGITGTHYQGPQGSSGAMGRIGVFL